MNRSVRALLAGAVAGGAVLGWGAVGGATGPAGLVFLLLLLAAVPVSRELPRRLMLMGAIVVGWWPVTWWWTWGAPVSRTTAGLVVLTAGLAAWVAAARGGPGEGVRDRARRLVPTVRATDLVVLAAGVLTAWLRWPWIAARSPEGALAALLPGWDHSAHFDITRMQRLHSVVVGQVPAAPHGDGWSYADYPQSAHSLLASLMELLVGPPGGDIRAEVLTYVRALGLLDVALVVMVTAGVCSLPALRRRPWAAATAATASIAVLLGPGGSVLTDGFAPFPVVLALLAVLPFLVVPAPRVVDPVRLAAVGGVLVGLAHGWTLALLIAAPAVLVLMLPAGRRRWRATWARWALAVGVVVTTAAAGAWAFLMVSGGVGLGDMIVIEGAITAPGLRWVVTTGGLAVVLTVAVRARLRFRPRWGTAGSRAEALRAAALVGVPVAAAITGGVIASVQLSAGEHLSYYFWKFAIASCVATGAVAVTAAAVMLPARPIRREALLGAAAVLLLLVGPGLVAGAGVRLPGSATREVVAGAMARPGTDVAELLAAASTAAAPDARRVTLTGVAMIHPIQAGQWVNALSGRWTDESNELLRQVPANGHEPAVMAHIAPGLLADPDTVVLVPAAVLEEVRGALAPDLAARILAW